MQLLACHDGILEAPGIEDVWLVFVVATNADAARSINWDQVDSGLDKRKKTTLDVQYLYVRSPSIESSQLLGISLIRRSTTKKALPIRRGFKSLLVMWIVIV